MMRARDAKDGKDPTDPPGGGRLISNNALTIQGVWYNITDIDEIVRRFVP